jgi:cell division protein FtsB
MRIFALALAVIMVLLQYRLWVSDQGIREVWRLKSAIEAQRTENGELTERNSQLAAEVTDLKGGMAALEERARSELGMVASNETFYQIVTPATPVPLAPAMTTARAQ